MAATGARSRSIAKLACISAVYVAVSLFKEVQQIFGGLKYRLRAGNVLSALSDAQKLLKRVADTGPLVSLLSASWVRHEFLRINRDLSQTFSILGSGEMLLVSWLERATAFPLSHLVFRQLSVSLSLSISQPHPTKKVVGVMVRGWTARRAVQWSLSTRIVLSHCLSCASPVVTSNRHMA